MRLRVEFVRDVAATADGGRLLTGSLSEHEGPADFGGARSKGWVTS